MKYRDTLPPLEVGTVQIFVPEIAPTIQELCNPRVVRVTDLDPFSTNGMALPDKAWVSVRLRETDEEFAVLRDKLYSKEEYTDHLRSVADRLASVIETVRKK